MDYEIKPTAVSQIGVAVLDVLEKRGELNLCGRRVTRCRIYSNHHHKRDDIWLDVEFLDTTTGAVHRDVVSRVLYW